MLMHALTLTLGVGLLASSALSRPVAQDEPNSLRVSRTNVRHQKRLAVEALGLSIGLNVAAGSSAPSVSPSPSHSSASSMKSSSSASRTRTIAAMHSSSATSVTKSSSAAKSQSASAKSVASSLSSAGHAQISSKAASASHNPSFTSSASAGASAKSTVATGCASASGDAPYSLSCSELGSVITVPDGFQDKEGGIVFLVHGTGSTGEETWDTGPYHTILPNKGKGYDIAWFTSPTRSLGDAQVTAEYIAYNIKVLAQKSKTGKVFLIGHSQGNINIQWALEFWPSMRQYVSGFVSLAGDFHGTAEGPLLCTGQDLLQAGCEPSVLQQSVGSLYLAAQNSKGGSALVTTTSLYTLEDDIIQPEVVNPTSDVPGASVLSVQQACPAYITDHFGMTVAAPAFYLAYDALTHGGSASLSRFNASMCTFLSDSIIPNPFVEIPGVIRQAALDAISVVAYEPKVFSEPKLMPYVCQKGAASSYCS